MHRIITVPDAGERWTSVPRCGRVTSDSHLSQTPRVIPRIRRLTSPARRAAERDGYFGFTLLEVVIALSLSILLLTAVYAAIRLQYRVSQAGREQMERAQIARAVLRQIENDVRSVVWQVQEPAQTDEEDSSTSAIDVVSTSTEPTVEIQSTDDAFTSASSGIFGDSQNLVLHISRPSRALVYARSAEEEADASTRSDQASVNYFIADAGAGGLAGSVAQQNGGGSSFLGGVVGLSRLEGDRLSIEMAGASGDDAALASAAQVLASEVVAIEFAYWDGLEWLDSWDSVASGALPSAIGITLSIDTLSSVEDRMLSNQLQQAVTTGESENTGEPVQIRYVIAVPLAEPYVSEASI